MIKRFILLTLILAIGYAVWFNLKLIKMEKLIAQRGQGGELQEKEPVQNKVYSFSFSKYTPEGNKELEIEGDSANIFSKKVTLSNVIAKAYAEDEAPITITADKGVFEKASSNVHLQQNVVATAETGARLLTDTLEIHPTEKILETQAKANVKKDNININGLGAKGDSQLKNVQFKKNVTVIIQNDDFPEGISTVITCDGPLDIDYENNIAFFKKNVVATDERGKLTADFMDVYYDKVTRKVNKIIAKENVIIVNKDGNTTYSDNVVYLAQEGRVILGGDTEALYFTESSDSDTDSIMFMEKGDDSDNKNKK